MHVPYCRNPAFWLQHYDKVHSTNRNVKNVRLLQRHNTDKSDRIVVATPIDVINVYYVFYSCHVSFTFLSFSLFFHIFFYFQKTLSNAKYEYTKIQR